MLVCVYMCFSICNTFCISVCMFVCLFFSGSRCPTCCMVFWLLVCVFVWRVERGTERAKFVGRVGWVEETGGEGPVGGRTFPDGLRYVGFTEAVTRSAQEGRAVALPL